MSFCVFSINGELWDFNCLARLIVFQRFDPKLFSQIAPAAPFCDVYKCIDTYSSSVSVARNRFWMTSNYNLSTCPVRNKPLCPGSSRLKAHVLFIHIVFSKVSLVTLVPGNSVNKLINTYKYCYFGSVHINKCLQLLYFLRNGLHSIKNYFFNADEVHSVGMNVCIINRGAHNFISELLRWVPEDGVW